MQTNKYHAQNLGTREDIHLPDRHTRYGNTPYTTKNTTPVSILLAVCVASGRMWNEFSSVNYQRMVCSKNMETHIRTAQYVNLFNDSTTGAKRET